MTSEALKEQIRSLLGDYDEAVQDYQEAQENEDETASVKDYETYEDRKLAFAESAETLLRRILEEES
jgi:hypothetical protein